METWAQKLTCPTCGEEFATVEQIAVHYLAVHQCQQGRVADRLVHDCSCPWCGAVFATREELKAHARRAHQPRR